MNTKNVLDYVLSSLDLTPEDYDLRNVLADYAEDNGEGSLAKALRFEAKYRKRPYIGDSGASWFNADTISSGIGDPESDIPGPVYEALEGGTKVANHKKYKSKKEAEEAFLLAFAKLDREGKVDSLKVKTPEESLKEGEEGEKKGEKKK
jgi:hypothetical protein